MNTCPHCLVDFYTPEGWARHRCDDLHLREVWDVLVEECGASEDPQAGHGFIAFAHYFGDRSDLHELKEFRFMGSLGFGGKVWHQPHAQPPIDVNYYAEDESPDRRAAAQRANERLARLFG